jgi:hypothetical protein
MTAPWTPERQALAFRAAYIKARGVDPGMGGKHVGQFHGQVTATAQAQGKPPAELFAKHLDTWLRERFTRDALRAPYAYFQTAWAELADIGPEPVAPPQRVRKERGELQAELSLLEGNLVHARLNAGPETIKGIIKSMDEVKAAMRRGAP